MTTFPYSLKINYKFGIILFGRKFSENLEDVSVWKLIIIPLKFCNTYSPAFGIH